MVRRRVMVSHKRIAIRTADKAIEQTVPMNVAAFLSAKKETDAAKPMNARRHSRQIGHRFFHGADGAQSRRRKDRGRAE
ncbi:MAG: hypothetical protein QOJ45_961 [Verrucomicrobiota bacterium]